jgi:hypothetical protein
MFTLVRITIWRQIVNDGGTKEAVSSWGGWIVTHKGTLDLLRPEIWKASFGNRLVDALLCEYMWEHLTEAEGRSAGGQRGQVSTIHLAIIFSFLVTYRLRRRSDLFSFINLR